MSKDGDTIAVGAVSYYYCHYDQNYVRVYRWRDHYYPWTIIGEINPKESDIRFGMSISLSDDGGRLGLVTAATNYGYARVFQYEGNSN